LSNFHALVLLSVVDHYYRLAKETSRRVVGVLLGEITYNSVEVTQCYALPFEEDAKDKKVWFLDHVYNETMFEMYQKINYKEVIVGWYSSGPKIRPHDIEINEVFRKYCQNPVFCIIDVQEKDSLGIPAEAFVMKEDVDIDGQIIKTFIKLQTVIEASLPEEIGVEFLLRDITESAKTTKIKMVNDKVTSLKALIQRLNEIKTYLFNVVSKKIVANPSIIYNIQEIFNYFPNFDNEEIIKSLSTQTNNNYLMLYLASLIRTTVSLHKLINNKLAGKEEEKEKSDKPKEDEKKKKEDSKDSKEGKDKENVNSDNKEPKK